MIGLVTVLLYQAMTLEHQPLLGWFVLTPLTVVLSFLVYFEGSHIVVEVHLVSGSLLKVLLEAVKKDT